MPDIQEANYFLGYGVKSKVTGKKEPKQMYIFSHVPCYIHYSIGRNSDYCLILYSLTDPQKLHNLLVGSVLLNQLNFYRCQMLQKDRSKDVFPLTKANFDITFKVN